MDSIAMYIGYAVIAMGAITTVMALLFLFVNYNWHKLQDVMSWAEVEDVLREVNRRRERKEKGVK